MTDYLLPVLYSVAAFAALTVVTAILYHVNLWRTRATAIAGILLALAGLFAFGAAARADEPAILVLIVVGHDGSVRAAQSSASMPQAMCESLAAAKRAELAEEYREVITHCVLSRSHIPERPNLPPAQRGA